MDFNEAKDDGVVEASDGPYANHLHFISTSAPKYSSFTGQMHSCYPIGNVKALKANYTVTKMHEIHLQCSLPQNKTKRNDSNY